MIDARIRRSVLDTFPAGTPCLVIAPPAAGYAALLAERGDPALELRDVTADIVPAATPHVVLEGLDAVSDPPALLAHLRERMPEARIFAAVANAAHLVALGAFFAGRPLAGGHPLMHAELAPLFAAGGWNVLAIKPLYDPALPGPESPPSTITVGAIGFQCHTPAVLERVRTAAYLVIADPA